MLNSLKNFQIVKNITGLSFFQMISSLLSLIVLPLLANNLGIQAFGSLMFLLLLNNYFNWIVQWGFYTGGTRSISIYRKNILDLSNIFSEIYSSQLFLIFMILAPYILTVIYFTQYDFFSTSSYFTISLFFISFNLIPIWFFNGLERINFGVIIQIYPKIIVTLAAVFFIKDATDIDKYFIASLIGILISLIHVYYEFLKIKITFNFKNPIPQIKKNFKLFVSSSSLSISYNSIPFFIGIFVSKEAVAIYTVAEKLKSFLLLLINPIYQAIFPRMCFIYQNNRKNFLSSLKKIFLVLLAINIFLVLFSIFNVEMLINLFFNQDYNKSINIFIYFLPSIFLNFFNSFIYYFVLIPMGFDHKLFVINILSFLLTTVISSFLIFNFSIKGAVLSVIISESIILILTIILNYKFLRK